MNVWMWIKYQVYVCPSIITPLFLFLVAYRDVDQNYLTRSLRCTYLLLSYLRSAFENDKSDALLKVHMIKTLKSVSGVWNVMWSREMIDYILEPNRTHAATLICNNISYLLAEVDELALAVQCVSNSSCQRDLTII